MNERTTPGPIALVTDFGTRDYFVGALKGVILSINRAARIVDVTHEIAPQDIRAAAFVLRACYRDFPAGTIFTAVVDPGVGSERRAILVETPDYYFIAPDNGLLSFVFDETPECRVFELTNGKFFAARVSATFHGRDVFAPVAAHLSNGVAPAEFGRAITDFVRFGETRPRPVSENEIEAEIVAADRFGNLVTNLKREDLPAKFRLRVGAATIERLQNYYAESAPGELFMIFGSAGFLEIVAFRASAKQLLQIDTGQKITVETNL
ncbi:MAG: SAM-dependent chlorinase/fluorinase [Acidobacteria bacterium]|nr:SAM-dependent chlorinase/fluorinase [Acidobacteriota bacterium]